VIMAHSAEDETAQGGLPCGGVSIVGEDEAVPNSTSADMMVERGRTVAGGDRVGAVRGEGEGADVRVPLAGGERARERKRLTGGAERSARERGERGAGEHVGGQEWAESGGRGREGGEEGRGPKSAQLRGGIFPFFLFLFSFP
jgi:hypothetical protein